MESSHSEQILRLRELTRRFGVVHDAQLFQLKIWPRIVFPKSTESETRLDPKKCTVTVAVTAKGRKPKDTQARATGLAQSIQLILGDHWSVKVTLNGDTVASLRRSKPVPRFEAEDVATERWATKLQN